MEEKAFWEQLFSLQKVQTYWAMTEGYKERQAVCKHRSSQARVGMNFLALDEVVEQDIPWRTGYHSSKASA